MKKKNGHYQTAYTTHINLMCFSYWLMVQRTNSLFPLLVVFTLADIRRRKKKKTENGRKEHARLLYLIVRQYNQEIIINEVEFITSGYVIHSCTSSNSRHTLWLFTPTKPNRQHTKKGTKRGRRNKNE